MLRRRQASANVFTFPFATASGGKGAGGDDPENNVFEAWRCFCTASFMDTIT